MSGELQSFMREETHKGSRQVDCCYEEDTPQRRAPYRRQQTAGWANT